MRLLAYGTLCGGFLSEKWLGKPEPQDIADWSKSKYKRFIDAGGGWDTFQALLAAADEIAAKHGVSISNVATRWVLDHDSVAAAIIGARLGENEHRDDNLKAFGFALDAEDQALLDECLRRHDAHSRRLRRRIPQAPLPHRLGRPQPSSRAPFPRPMKPCRCTHRAGTRVSTGSVWEPIAGYSRAVRVRDMIFVSGTTATHASSRCVAPGDAGAQATYILDKIAASLAAAGGRIEDVVRTRIYLRDASKWEPVSRAHGRVFGKILPANTLIEAKLVGDYEVEIEADAIADTPQPKR